MSQTIFGTTFKYGIKGSQITGCVVQSFDHEDSSRINVELLNELGQLVGVLLDDGLEKLTISAVVTAASAPEKNTVITFAAQSGETSSPGGVASKKYRVEKVKIAGKNNDKLMVNLDLVANEYITLP